MCILFILIRNTCIMNVFDISYLQFLCFLNNEKPSNRTQNNLTKKPTPHVYKHQMNLLFIICYLPEAKRTVTVNEQMYLMIK